MGKDRRSRRNGTECEKKRRRRKRPNRRLQQRHSSLGDLDVQTKLFTYYGFDGLDPRVANQMSDQGSTIKRFVALEPNHSHFVLIDDGTSDFPRDNLMRPAIEGGILNHAESSHFEDPAPAVLVVIHGGLGTIAAVSEALVRGRPVVVCASSGGAATGIYEFCCKLEMQEAENPMPRFSARRSSTPSRARTAYTRWINKLLMAVAQTNDSIR